MGFEFYNCILRQEMVINAVLISYDRKGDCKPYILLFDSNTDEKLSLPGGFLEEMDESIEDSIVRILHQQTGLEFKPSYFNLCYLKNNATDENKDRDATAGYYVIIDTLPTPSKGAKWVDLNELLSGSFNNEEAETISAALKQLAINAKRIFYIINPKEDSDVGNELEAQVKCFEELYVNFRSDIELDMK